MLSFNGSVQDLNLSPVPGELFSPDNIDTPIFFALSEDSTHVILSSNYDEFSGFQSALTQPVSFTVVCSPRTLVLASDFINSLFVLAIYGLTGK